jgi:hypothetical protein
MMPFMQPPEPTEEEKAAIEKLRMHGEDLMNRFRRLISEELTPEQLEVLGLTYKSIVLQGTALAAWYDGLLMGALFVRDVRLGEVMPDAITHEQPDGT